MRSQPDLGLQEKTADTRGLHFVSAAPLVSGPVFTCIVVRSLGMNGYIVADIVLLLPEHSEGLVWPLTQTSWGRFGTPLLERRSMNGVRAVYRTTMSLNMATPEHQPVDEIETYVFSWLGHGHGATVGHVGHRFPSRSDRPPVPGRAGLFTAWGRSCR